MIPIKLKRKYLQSSVSTGGKSSSRDSKSTRKEGAAALMQHETARDLHFMDCALGGHWEQIPPTLLPKYRKRVADYRDRDIQHVDTPSAAS